MKKISERNIFLRLVALIAGLILISAGAEIFKLITKEYFNVTYGGALPAMAMYGVPMIILMTWLGFFKSKNSINMNSSEKVEKENWNTSDGK